MAKVCMVEGCQGASDLHRGAVKDAGRLRVEGKEYVVLDGDVVHFRFSGRWAGTGRTECGLHQADPGAA